MKKEVKTICKKMIRIPGILFIAMSVCLVSCSDDDDKAPGSAELIQKHDLPGTYSIEISPSFMGGIPVSSGTYEAAITNEGDGVLRLNFGGFQALPMPFVMSADVQFTLS